MNSLKGSSQNRTTQFALKVHNACGAEYACTSTVTGNRLYQYVRYLASSQPTKMGKSMNPRHTGASSVRHSPTQRYIRKFSVDSAISDQTISKGLKIQLQTVCIDSIVCGLQKRIGQETGPSRQFTAQGKMILWKSCACLLYWTVGG